jgi:hypothetical protein
MVMTGVVFIAISVIGGLIGNALDWPPFATSAVTAIFAVAFAMAMTNRIKKLK